MLQTQTAESADIAGLAPYGKERAKVVAQSAVAEFDLNQAHKRLAAASL